MERRLLTTAEAAGCLGRTEGAMDKLAYRREVPFVKVGRSRRFDIRALDRWIDEHTVEAEPEPWWLR